MAAAAFVEVAVEVAYALHSVSILAAGDVDHCQRQYRNEDAGRHVVVRVNPLLYEPVEAAVVVATIPVDHHWGSAADSAAAAAADCRCSYCCCCRWCSYFFDNCAPVVEIAVFLLDSIDGCRRLNFLDIDPTSRHFCEMLVKKSMVSL